jgi:hypothetical protein
VAHYGHIIQSHIKEHVKLFGQDVITVHRLLKNDIPHHEYALFTQALGDEWPQAATPAWAQREEGSQTYDVGRVNFGYVPLVPLRRLVPEPRVEDFSLPGVTVQLFSCEHQVLAPLGLVFEVASDLPTRLQWIHGAKHLEMQNQHLNRLGTKHRCVVDKHSPVVITSGTTRDADSITLTETDDKKTVCVVYAFRREGERQTCVRVDGFVRDALILRTLFKLFFKKKLTQQFQASGEKLKQYCEELYEAQRT